jgi:hypothetical protein
MKSLLIVSAILALSFSAAGQTTCALTGVTVTLSPPVAAVGQTIQVTLTNNSGQTINLPTSCTYFAIYAKSSCSSPAAFTPQCLQVITPVPNGQSHSMAWNQKDNGGVQVPAGFYSVEVRYFDGAGMPLRCCVPGEISAVGTIYCTAKVNACGTLPAIGASGAPSASAGSGFTVSTTSSKGTKCGLVLYGDAGPAQPPFPFNGGVLCIAPTVRRSIGICDSTGTPGACDGTLALDMNAFATGALGGNPLASLLVPGTQINCQFWGRDTPGNSLLSDALEYVVGP